MLLLSAVAPNVYAFPSSLQALSPDQFNLLAYAAIACAGLLLLVILLGVFKRSRLNTQLNKANSLLTVQQERLNAVSVGVILVDEALTVTYANRTGAYLLGQNADTVKGKGLADLLPVEAQNLLAQARGASRELTIQCVLGQRERAYRLRINPALSQAAEAQMMIIVEDVQDYQQRLDDSAAMLDHVSGLFDGQSLGLAKINLAAQQFTVNESLAGWLGIEPGELSMGEFMQRVEARDQQMLSGALERLASGEVLEVNTSLLAKDDSLIPVTFSGALAEHTSESDSPIAHISVADCRQITRTKTERDIAIQRFNALVSTATQPVYLLDAERKFVDANRAFLSLFNTDLMYIKGKPVSELKQFDEGFTSLHQTRDKMTTRRQALTVERDDGQRLSLQVVLQALAGESGAAMGIIEDHTELEALTHDIAEAKDRLSMFTDHSPMGIAVFNREGDIKEVNQTLCRQLDMNSQQLLSQSFYQLFTDKAEIDKLTQRLDRHDQAREFPARLKCGTNKTFSTTLHANKISEIPEEYVCWIGSREEQDYLNSRFERLVKYASVPVALLTNDCFTQFNSAACAFFGIQDEEEMLGLQLTAPELHGATTNTETLAQKLETVGSRGQVVTLSWQHQYQQRVLPCELTLIPILRDAKLQGIICIWIDLRAIEQAKAARAEAVKLREAAELEVEAKQQQLASSQHQLAQQQEALAETEQTLAQAELKLQDAEVTLSEKIETISELQQAHKDISEHLASLKSDYTQNREMLEESQQANAALEAQLERSSMKVGSLEKQRNQIADALQYSERKYREAQQQLEQSQQDTLRLEQQQAEQQKAVENYVAEIAGLQASIEDKDKQIGDVSGQIAALQSQLISSSEASEKLREQLANQRKASEQAERERRELAMAYQKMQAEAEGKARHIDHLQHEMQMLEAMSSQQKGDMQAHAEQLAKELEAKQSQLQSTQTALAEIKQQAEQDKQEKVAQQERLAQLQNELADIESRSAQQQSKVAEADARRKAEHEALQQALQAKQAELQQTEQILSDAKQQTEAEKQEKARQQAIQQSEQKWQAEQQTLANELAAKQAKLVAAEAELDNRHKQMEAEKLERESQQNKLEQLKSEMADVAQRAAKQKEMMLGSDEQWRKHHEEIEAQKQQLQQALEEAQSQNSAMQNKLQSSMNELADAEEKVSLTQSEEQKLQQELNRSKEQAQALEAKLAQQEEQEAKLQAQVQEQQSALKSSQSSIEQLEEQQQLLTEQLETVQREYAASQQSLTQQNSSQSDLHAQLSSLEGELSERKSQLESREKALQQAQAKLKDSESKLAEQEKALVEAQKVELQQAQEGTVQVREKPDFADLAMPPDPNTWFDLLNYLQSSHQVSSMATSLTSLMDKLAEATRIMDDAVMADDHRAILMGSRRLISVISTVNSAPLKDMESRLSADCNHDNIDNISIYWPMAKQNLQRTLRVIYSHLYED
ncbi:MAG: PAS domain-containing protein [Alteromonas oceani]